jgi:hypothetical protein
MNNKFTEEQYAAWREKYFSIIQSTKSELNLEEVTQHVHALYDCASLTRPRKVAIVNSPLQAIAAAALGSLILQTKKFKLNLPQKITRMDYEIVQAVAYIADIDLSGYSPEITEERNYIEQYCIPSAGKKALSDFFGLGEEGVETIRAARCGLRIGSLAAGDHSHLSFFQEHDNLNIDYNKLFNDYRWLQENTGGGVYGPLVCVIFHKPIRVNLIRTPQRFQAHYEHGPYMEWADGFGIFALEGVQVPAWVVLTPAEELDPSRVLSIVNADARSMAMKKLGYHRLKDHLKVTVIDPGFDGYELWTMEFEGRKIGPYLKMVNPSTKMIHVEGVPAVHPLTQEPITTCKQALAARAKRKKWTPPLWVA